MGSLVFMGLVIGSVTASFVFYKISYKLIIIVSLLLNGFALWSFTAFSNYYAMCLARFLAGYSQIYLTIYIPLYIDTYVKKSQKSFLMGMVITSAPIGVVIGYAMTGFIINSDGGTWWLPFRIMCFISWTFAILAIFVPA